MTTVAVEEVTWQLADLLSGQPTVDGLLDRAEAIAEEVAAHRDKVGQLDRSQLEQVMRRMGEMHDLAGRATSFSTLRFAADTTDPANGALMQHVQERLTSIRSRLIFFELEWSALPDQRAAELLSAPELTFCRHHLEVLRRMRPHLLSEPEERILTEKAVTGPMAWDRLFDELISGVELQLDGATVGLEEGLARLRSADRDKRRQAAQAITEGLAPGLRTRAFVYNTLLYDKAIDDRLRHFDHWLASRNLANEASDQSVEALVEAVRSRYDIAQRWYRLKARLLGVDRLADYDRMAPVAAEEPEVGWDEARTTVLDSYASFSAEMADIARRFFDERWIDAPVRPGKRPGAFCDYTVPSVHPYLLLNFTSRRSDILTLAHELGHGIHGVLASGQGIFHQEMPLTLAETASVFGETVTFGRLLGQTTDAESRLALLAEHVDGAVATVFRQTAMNRFEHLVHTARRHEGELSVDRLGELWADSQAEMFGDSVEVTEGYRSWWSYIPHFISTPGYVYAYAYGQLLSLSVYRRYEENGAGFVPRYLELLAAGGSDSPDVLARLVGCDLSDPAFWHGGLEIIEGELAAAEQAAADAGKI
ncbi:MAG TPA: M3 family oligoendopeptidase [Acidimicrobiales bacterium]|nr:M3 family oligoendopeptidase [Acidimicrobiales bacterium]